MVNILKLLKNLAGCRTGFRWGLRGWSPWPSTKKGSQEKFSPLFLTFKALN